MVLFDQLRISDDGKKMYINIHVNKADYFENVYLDTITIMSADKVSETHQGMPTDDYLYTHTFEGNQKEAGLVLTALDFTKTWGETVSDMTFTNYDMSHTLFFVYVKCKLADGTSLDPCIPCTLDEEVTLGVTFDTNLLYQHVMGYTKEFVQDCTIPQGFTDYILLWNAFKASVETEHYIPAIKFYNMLMGNTVNSGNSGSHKGCGCHG